MISECMEKIERSDNINYSQDVAIDEIQQYQRRDCLEVTGIPKLPTENTKEIMMELASAIEINLDEEDISTTLRK